MIVNRVMLAGVLAAAAGLSGAALAQDVPLRPPALVPSAPASKSAPAKPIGPKPASTLSASPAGTVHATAPVQGAAPAPVQARGTIPLPVPRPSSLGTRTAAADGGEQVAVAAKSPAAAPSADPQVMLARVNDALNAMSMMSSDFVQTNASGRRASGKLYVQKPGRLRFEYDPPSPLEIVADGRSVVIRDRKLNTQDMYSIAQTPLKFLLRDKIDLSRDTNVLDVRSEGDRTTVTLEDKSTFGGTSRIALAFDSRSLALKQWTVKDPQGYETVVALSNLDVAQRPDPSLFTINYERMIKDK
jgi:outer membrane lipoprotein-sorting protein